MRFGLAVAGLLVAAGLASSPASAYLVKANVQCPDVLKEDANPTFRLQNNWWVLGYISALNYANDTSRGEGVSSEDVYSLLLDFCEKNPEADIDEAGQYLYNIMR